jgi:hypothetical protein
LLVVQVVERRDDLTQGGNWWSRKYTILLVHLKVILVETKSRMNQNGPGGGWWQEQLKLDLMDNGGILVSSNYRW